MAKISPQGYIYGKDPKSTNPFWDEEGGGGDKPSAEIGDITASASVDEKTGTPSVEVTKTESADTVNFDFAFSGIKGEKGTDGKEGPQGPKGDTGATGPQGPAGEKGADGKDGATGATGPQGPAGPEGPRGPEGARGPEGPQGPAGATGATGPAGADGAPGKDGASPTVESTGSTESGALAGTITQGENVINVYNGAKGEQGERGPQGPAGADGAQGETPDVTATASVDDTTGTPSVEVTKDGRALHFAFSGIKGERGETGAKGATGATGPAGADGAPGKDGATGATGPEGPQGPEGPRGPEGPQGPAGPAGADGATGPQGPAGDPVSKAGLVSNVSVTNENGIYTVKQTKYAEDGTTETESEIGTIEVPAQESGIVEVKDTVVNGSGYDFHTITETQDDGTENEVGKFYLAKNQIVSLNVSGNNITFATINQEGQTRINTGTIDAPQLSAKKFDSSILDIGTGHKEYAVLITFDVYIYTNKFIDSVNIFFPKSRLNDVTAGTFIPGKYVYVGASVKWNSDGKYNVTPFAYGDKNIIDSLSFGSFGGLPLTV